MNGFCIKNYYRYILFKIMGTIIYKMSFRILHQSLSRLLYTISTVINNYYIFGVYYFIETMRWKTISNVLQGPAGPPGKNGFPVFIHHSIIIPKNYLLLLLFILAHHHIQCSSDNHACQHDHFLARKNYHNPDEQHIYHNCF